MNLLRGYIREMLSEKQVRDQKKKRVLYHIGPRPAKPMPMSRPYAQSWRRYWLDQGVESGVFFSPNPIDIAQYHGISGDVYAYKIPEWVIAKAGGVHRYDHGSEVLISADVWQEAGDEIEFLGKSMPEKELWEKIESLGAEPLRRSAGSRPGWMSDDEWERSSANKAIQSHISGLRFTKHLKNAIRMMKPNERAEALAAFETIDTPGKKDYEIIDMIKSYMNETALRGYIRELLVEKSLTGRNLERVAKAIGHEVSQSLKDNEIKAFFSKPDRDFPLEFRLDYTPPEKLIWLRHVIIKMNPPVGNQHFSASGAYEYSIDAPEEERRNSDLILNLFMPTDYTDKEIDKFATKIMGTIRHELEHSGQPTEDLQATQKKIKDEDDIFSSLENIEKYYIDKAETPSHIADWVLQAKREGENAADVIDWELQNVYATALHKGYTEGELGPVMKRIREVYQYYLISRWPQQDWPAEMRDEE